MNNTVIVYDEFFNRSDLSKINEHSLEIYLNKKYKDSNWSTIDYSKPILNYELPIVSESYNIIKNRIKKITDDDIYSIMFYFGPPGSYVIWHNDYIYSSAISVYLNEEWDYRNGGNFNYEIDGTIHTVVPRLNTGVYQSGGVYHSTTITTPNSDIRRSVQVFLKKYNKTLL